MILRVLLCVVFIGLLSCSSDDERQNNPNLLNIQFGIELNLNFPEYSPLNFIGNAVYVDGQGIGNDGIIVVNTGSGYVAWDASDPNEFPSSCTRLQIDGLSASSNCNPPNSYSLVTGQPLEDGLQFGLLNYRVEVGSGSLFVSN
jgi:hypothetical protein